MALDIRIIATGIVIAFSAMLGWWIMNPIASNMVNIMTGVATDMGTNHMPNMNIWSLVNDFWGPIIALGAIIGTLLASASGRGDDTGYA